MGGNIEVDNERDGFGAATLRESFGLVSRNGVAATCCSNGAGVWPQLRVELLTEEDVDEVRGIESDSLQARGRCETSGVGGVVDGVLMLTTGSNEDEVDILNVVVVMMIVKVCR
jgi:hypothetical protein